MFSYQCSKAEAMSKVQRLGDWVSLLKEDNHKYGKVKPQAGILTRLYTKVEEKYSYLNLLR